MMTQFSYHISHEQFSPGNLLELVRHAEDAGFDAAFSSDHLQPWAPAQGHSGFAWAWLGAALQATKRLSFGVISVPGGWRYSPVVLAQAIATLGQMFPGRVPWVALGSGQAVNEATTGQPWPDKAERNARLKEGAEIIRALLAGETVTHRGRVSVVDARIWSRPEQPTRLVGAATSEATAEWLGSWADGLLTVGTRPAALRRTIEAFRRGGGEGKPIYLKADVSWAASENEALRQAHEQWRFNLLGGDVNWELRTPLQFETAARFVRPEDMREAVLISADPARLANWLAEFAALGFDSIDLHQVGTDQHGFIDIFGGKVLPALRL
jgi:probable non-F420 flavinoid oxidoreductase